MQCSSSRNCTSFFQKRLSAVQFWAKNSTSALLRTLFTTSWHGDGSGGATDAVKPTMPRNTAEVEVDRETSLATATESAITALLRSEPLGPMRELAGSGFSTR